MNLDTHSTDKKISILTGLNPAQKLAVEQRGAPLLVLAGAGSGKTKVLTHRIAHMILSGIHPANILAVTFTNKAAKEMKERLTKIIGEEDVKYSWIGTFHSICFILFNELYCFFSCCNHHSHQFVIISLLINHHF